MSAACGQPSNSASRVTTQAASVSAKPESGEANPAWVRTSTSLIAFGFTIYQLFAYLERQPGVRGGVVKPGVVGIVMIVIAIVVLLLAWIQHPQGVRALRAQYGPMPRSIAGIMAAVIAALGVLALLAVVLRT